MNAPDSNIRLPLRGAIILAGGKSSRMGVPKATLPFGSSNLLETVASTLQKVCNELVVVGPVPAEVADRLRKSWSDQVLFAEDQHPDRGPLEGIRVGLSTLSPDVEVGFVTPCDAPLLTPELVAGLFDLLEQSAAVVPVQGARIYGLTAVYTTRLIPELERRIARGQLRVADLAELVNARKIDAESLRRFDPELGSLTNLNRPRDYLELLTRTGQSCPADILQQLTGRH